MPHIEYIMFKIANVGMMIQSHAILLGRFLSMSNTMIVHSKLKNITITDEINFAKTTSTEADIYTLMRFRYTGQRRLFQGPYSSAFSSIPLAPAYRQGFHPEICNIASVPPL